ncbi:MAG: toll/interleukin-1 receptor domain-containing protein [Hyphomonadaceae bacterium]|nr:toll/interleukin-1 receptor domain-containing protein [Hyphomonadaceae bacterium]
MGTIYISHASDADARLLDGIILPLRSAGHFVSVDRDFRVGDEPVSRLVQATIKSADMVLVLWSPKALGSKQIRDGAHFALGEGKLFQVLIGVEAAPEPFDRHSAFDISDWDGGASDRNFTALLSDIKERLTPEGRSFELGSGARSEAPPSSRDYNVGAPPDAPDWGLVDRLGQRAEEAEKRALEADDRAREFAQRLSEAQARTAEAQHAAENAINLLRAGMPRRAVRRIDPRAGPKHMLARDLFTNGDPPSTRGGSAFPADATAFAPKKLRRGTSEIVRVFVHPPTARKAVERIAKAADERTADAGPASPLGYVQRGAMIGVLLDVKGGEVAALSTDKPWSNEPIEFVFTVEATDSERVAQAILTARILVDGAQIGLIAFARPLSKLKANAKPPKSLPVSEKFRKAKRVFLSYSSQDREPVALVAGAYRRAGIPCFFDRTSLESGEEWSPRLLKEIRKADLFHLFWSRNASSSEWVVKETEHALRKRRASWTKRPNITVQMLDGPPWAPHPPHLDAINFDDFLRAAVVGYARGDGS